MNKKGKHRKPGLFRTLFPKRKQMYERLTNLPKSDNTDMSDKRVLFMPRETYPYIPLEMSPN